MAYGGVDDYISCNLFTTIPTWPLWFEEDEGTLTIHFSTPLPSFPSYTTPPSKHIQTTLKSLLQHSWRQSMRTS